MIPIEIRDEARFEIHEAFVWYEEKQPGLGYQFLFALDAAIEQIRRRPGSFLPVGLETRRALLRRFPYSVVFQPEDDRIIVLAVYHGFRRPHGWADRVSEPAVLISTGLQSPRCWS